LTVQLLDGLGEAERREVRAAMHRRRFTKSMIVFHEGDPGNSCHVVTKGRFAVSVSTPLGQSAVMWLPGPDDVFGEMALLGGRRDRTATVTALEPAETLELHRDRFDELCRSHPSVMRILVDVLARNVERTTELAIGGLFHPVDRRVGRQLGLLAALYLGDAGAGPIPVHQEVVAAMAGTTRPTVNRVLKQAEADGILRLARGRIEVLDRARLDRLAR
jgi:CRP/FNR family transcriptional regulator, cyclic AMP receptor protein